MGCNTRPWTTKHWWKHSQWMPCSFWCLSLHPAGDLDANRPVPFRLTPNIADFLTATGRDRATDCCHGGISPLLCAATIQTAQLPEGPAARWVHHLAQEGEQMLAEEYPRSVGPMCYSIQGSCICSLRMMDCPAKYWLEVAVDCAPCLHVPPWKESQRCITFWLPICCHWLHTLL